MKPFQTIYALYKGDEFLDVRNSKRNFREAKYKDTNNTLLCFICL